MQPHGRLPYANRGSDECIQEKALGLLDTSNNVHLVVSLVCLDRCFNKI